MQAIIIGAGRGSRLMPTTADVPKCFATVAGKRMLDWILEAFRANGIEHICFIGGYQIDRVRETNPEFTFAHNVNWQDNNIMESLMCAESSMNAPFVCCYSDILFTPQGIADLLGSDHDISLLVDTDWKTRYVDRTEHPTDDAEKVTVERGQVTRIHRLIAESDAYGEFAGVAKFSEAGAAALREHYHHCRRQFAGQPFREARQFEKAYLIHLLQDMLEQGTRMSHIDTPGGYIEIDTQQDFEYARRHWASDHFLR